MRYINPKRHLEFTAIPDWLMRRSEVSLNAKVCYSRLARYFDESRGYAWPGIQTLADELAMSTRQVDRHLAELKKLRLIQTNRPGHGITNRYYFPDHPWRDDTASAPRKGDVYVPPDSPDVSYQDTTRLDPSNLANLDPSNLAEHEASNLADKDTSRRDKRKKQDHHGAVAPAGGGGNEHIQESTPSPPGQPTRKHLNASLVEDWRASFSKTPNAAQLKRLSARAIDAAAATGRPAAEEGHDAIIAAAEAGAGAQYAYAVLERRAGIRAAITARAPYPPGAPPDTGQPVSFYNPSDVADEQTSLNVPAHLAQRHSLKPGPVDPAPTPRHPG